MAFPLYPELRLALPRTSMGRKLEEFQPDLLHLLEPALLGVGGIYYADQLRIPLAISYHTNLPAYLSYYKLGWIEKLTWKLMQVRHSRADLNLCTSTAMIDDLRAHGIGHLALWDRAVDADLFQPGLRPLASEAPESRGRRLLYVGRLSAEKDVIQLKKLFTAIPGMTLDIVGDGPLRQHLEQQFAGTATVFRGYLKGRELASAYAAADLFVLPSQTETLGLVLMEAMAAGCPVVACRAGGVPDAVIDRVTGFLFDPDLPENLTATVQDAIGDPVRLQAVRANARQEVERHSWSGATDQLRALYSETIYAARRSESRTPSPLPKRIARNIARGTLRTLLP